MLPISTLSPDHEMATIGVVLAIMPRSPWLASLGCTKNAGVPVEAKVAASFWSDMAALADAGHDHAPLARGQHLDGLAERLPQLLLLQRRLQQRSSLRFPAPERAPPTDGGQPVAGTGRSFPFATAFACRLN